MTLVNEFETLIQKASASHADGRLEDAVKYFRQAWNLNPEDVLIPFNLGLTLHMLGRNEEARKALEKAVSHHPDDAEALHILGVVHTSLGDHSGALPLLERAVDIAPHSKIHYALGVCYWRVGRLGESETHFVQALDLDPNDADAAMSLGAVQSRNGRYDEAIENCQRALTLNPNHADAHYNLGKFYQIRKDYKLAIYHGQKAHALRPNDPDAASTYFQHKQQACDWDGIEQLASTIDVLVNASLAASRPAGEHPFINISRTTDLARNYAVAESRSQAINEHVKNQKLNGLRATGQKSPLIVGYLSSDFRDHPLGHLMLNFFALHNRTRVKVHAYSLGPNDSSIYRETIEESCDRFVDLSKLSDHEAANQIAIDGVDILVDLNSHTTGSRMEICAFRPAVLQITYLGFPGTSGAKFFDYIVTDQIVTPLEHAPHYSEKFLWMPECYYITNHAEIISEKVYVRGDMDLPTDGFVFACFSQVYKITPELFAVWMALLNRISDSVLWLFASNDLAKENLKKEAAAASIDPDRIIFAGDLPKPDHLARLSLADLGLDTLVYGGHTTTVDALVTNVPVITIEGTHFSSRVSSSILSAIGLQELVCNDLGAYHELAIALATDLNRLASFRQKIMINRIGSPLFDAEKFVSYLEDGLEIAWNKHVEGKPPDHIQIEKK